VSLGWLLAVVLGVFLFGARQDLRTLRARLAAEQETRGKRERALTASYALATLRLQLKRMHEAGQLQEGQYEVLTDGIDACLASEREGTSAEPEGELWWSSCETAWNILMARGLIQRGPPPWQKEMPAPKSERAPVLEALVKEGVGQPPEAPESDILPPTTAALPVQPAPQREAGVGTTPAPDVSREAVPAQPSKRHRAAVHQGPAKAARPTAPGEAHAWLPAESGPLDRALRAVSGWPNVLVPFLAQNVGWFIGGFLFLAGSVFLVAYTTGFTKAIIVFASLFAYTIFLSWAGHKLLQIRPSLPTASSVLLSTSLLLVPLTIAAVTRLMMTAGTSVLLWMVAVGAVILCLGVFYFAAQVISGVVHRSLRGDFPRLFLAIAALQLGAPLIALWSDWQLIAMGHLLLLALLAYGLLRFANEWLLSIFVDRKKVAYIAAGSLLYAAVVAFVHLTWAVSTVSLPAGYYAPYLMVVSGLLFYLDAQFKTHAHQHTFLSRFTFFVYGLSIVAALLALEAPVARLITLGLGALLYAMVLAKYLTLIPLYLMLASLAGLYAYGILVRFPQELHLLLAVPGLYGLSASSRWATKRGAADPVSGVYGLRRVGGVTYRITLSLLVALAVWSLADSAPGPLAMTSGFVLTVALWWLLRVAPGAVIGRAPAAPGPVNLLQGPWVYAPISALTVTLAFASRGVGVSWATHFSLALMLLSLLWVTLLVWGRRAHVRRWPGQSEAYANSVLLSVALGTALAGLWATEQFGLSAPTVIALAMGAVVLLVLALNLYVGWVFYAFLAWAGATAAAVKLVYFPQRGVGLVEMLGVAVLWVFLWRLDRQPDELSETARRRAWRDGPRRLLWLFPGCSESDTAHTPEVPLAVDARPLSSVDETRRAPADPAGETRV
jgi:hypothetical protein